MKGQYIEIVGQVVAEEAHNDHAKWSFTPEVEVEMLPEDEREEAKKMYDMVDIVAATEIEAVVENKFSAVIGAFFASNVAADVKAVLRKSWLRANYTQVVARVLHARWKKASARKGWSFSPAVPIDTLAKEEQPSSSLKRCREVSDGTCDNAPTPKKASTVTDVAAHPGATLKRSSEASATTPVDAPTPTTSIRRRCGETSTGVPVKKLCLQ